MATAIDKVLDLQKQFEQAKGAAVQELLDTRAKIDDQLKALGYGIKEKVKSATGVTRTSDPNRPCKVCGKTATQLGVERHDARSHRKGGKKKSSEAKK